MAEEQFTHKGMTFDIETFPIAGKANKFGCGITRVGGTRGLVLCEPDAVKNNGRHSEFDSEAEAIFAGKAHIKTEFLKD
jgi:hypothetical protein